MCPLSGELTVSVWSAGGVEAYPNQQTRQPPIHSEKYQCRIATVLLMMGT